MSIFVWRWWSQEVRAHDGRRATVCCTVAGCKMSKTTMYSLCFGLTWSCLSPSPLPFLLNTAFMSGTYHLFIPRCSYPEPSCTISFTYRCIGIYRYSTIKCATTISTASPPSLLSPLLPPPPSPFQYRLFSGWIFSAICRAEPCWARASSWPRICVLFWWTGWSR